VKLRRGIPASARRMRIAVGVLAVAACRIPDRDFPAIDSAAPTQDAASDAVVDCTEGQPCGDDDLCFEGVCGGDQVTYLGEGCVVRKSGSVWCWGDNTYGQVGIVRDVHECGYGCVHQAVRVRGVTGAIQVARSIHHACAVTAMGEIWCWGSNSHDQLGHSSADDDSCGNMTGSCNDRAQRVQHLPVDDPAVEVAAGHHISCARTRRGAVLCWGDNHYGGLGTGRQLEGETDHPQPVAGLGDGVLSIRAAASKGGYACAIKGDRTVWCWGLNVNGQLGHPAEADEPCADGRCAFVPVQVIADVDGHPLVDVVEVAPGTRGACARVQSGKVWCWGTGTQGLLGRKYLTTEAQPAPVPSNPAGAAALTVTGEHACMVTTQGHVYCWGLDQYAQLGYGESFLPPVDCNGHMCRPEPQQVLRVRGLQVSSSSAATYVLDPDGVVLSWGANISGQLGHLPGALDDASCDGVTEFPKCSLQAQPVWGLSPELPH